jgi:RNA polymerase sigma-70 factor (ECF subfamily)
VESVTKWLPAAGAEAHGETLSFERVFADHFPYVGRCLRYLGVAEADVEDACQEVFMVVHRRLGVFESPTALRAWIRQICVHVAQNQRRSRMRKREVNVADPVDVAEPPDQHRHLERTELRERLLRLLDELAEEQRTVFVLFEIERMTMAEVASVAKCPLQTAYSRLHAARKRIEQAIELQDAEDEP